MARSAWFVALCSTACAVLDPGLSYLIAAPAGAPHSDHGWGRAQVSILSPNSARDQNSTPPIRALSDIAPGRPVMRVDALSRRGPSSRS
jgi:hypothetical protein